MIVPSYSDPYWTQTSADKSGIEKRKEELGKKDWWWLHRVNRVQTSVFKTLVLVYVEIPTPWDKHSDVDIGEVLKKYTVREVVIRRWSPNRNRD
jgi:tRNA-splicing endonuclease subunit Sen2